MTITYSSSSRSAVCSSWTLKGFCKRSDLWLRTESTGPVCNRRHRAPCNSRVRCSTAYAIGEGRKWPVGLLQKPKDQWK